MLLIACSFSFIKFGRVSHALFFGRRFPRENAPPVASKLEAVRQEEICRIITASFMPGEEPAPFSLTRDS